MPNSKFDYVKQNLFSKRFSINRIIVLVVGVLSVLFAGILPFNMYLSSILTFEGARYFGSFMFYGGITILLYVGLTTRFHVDWRLRRQGMMFMTLMFCVLSVFAMVSAPIVNALTPLPSDSGPNGSSAYKRSVPISQFEWFIAQFRDGTYYAINGSDWNIMTIVEPWQPVAPWAALSTNLTALTQQCLSVTTSGIVYMKELSFNYNLTIPANVLVISTLNGVESRFTTHAIMNQSLATGLTQFYYDSVLVATINTQTGTTTLAPNWVGSWNTTIQQIVDAYTSMAWKNGWNSTIQQLVNSYQNYGWQGAWNSTVQQLVTAYQDYGWQGVWNSTVSQLIGSANNVAWQGTWNTTVQQLVTAYQDYGWQGAWNVSVQQLQDKSWQNAWNTTVQQLVTTYQDYSWQGSWNTTVNQLITNAFLTQAWNGNWNSTVIQLISGASILWSQITNANATVQQVVDAYSSMAWKSGWNTTVQNIVTVMGVGTTWQGSWNATVTAIVNGMGLSSSGGNPVQSYTYVLYYNSTDSKYYSKNGGDATITSSSNTMTLLQSTVTSAPSGSIISIKSPFIAYGTLNITKPVTLMTGLKAAYSGSTVVANVDFFNGTIPFIQSIKISSSTANLEGITIQGFNIQNLNFSTSNSKSLRFVAIRDCYFYMNTTNHGVSFNGEGQVASYIDSVQFDNCMVFMEDNYGLTYGAFTFGNQATHMTNMVMTNMFFYINNSNQTVFLNDGTAQLDDLQLEAYVLSESTNTNVNVFTLLPPTVDWQCDFVVNWRGGAIESASDLTMIKLLDGNDIRQLTMFNIHNLDYIDATTGSNTITLLADAVTGWYPHNRQVLFTNNYVDGLFSLGSSVYLQTQDLVVRDNYGYNDVGFVPLSIKLVDEYMCIDNGGNRDIPSGSTVYVYGSDVMIYGNATSTTTVTAVSINGQAVAPVLPIHVSSGDSFAITYTGGVPVVFKK